MQKHLILASAVAALFSALPAHADNCSQLAARGLTYSALQASVRNVVNAPLVNNQTPNGGLNFPMWLTLVDGSGRVCAVTNSLVGAQNATADIWLGSRVISAQKANTANSFSIGGLALSTANLYSAVQPGGSLFGLQESNPVDVTVAYQGNAANFGTAEDPLVGQRIGGINVFGGGLTLYSPTGVKIGAIGVSGDTSCTDHVVAWKVRAGFQASKVLGAVPAGPFGIDRLIQDIVPNPAGGTGVSASGFGHPTCLFNPSPTQAGDAIVF